MLAVLLENDGHCSFDFWFRPDTQFVECFSYRLFVFDPHCIPVSACRGHGIPSRVVSRYWVGVAAQLYYSAFSVVAAETKDTRATHGFQGYVLGVGLVHVAHEVGGPSVCDNGE